MSSKRIISFFAFSAVMCFLAAGYFTVGGISVSAAEITVKEPETDDSGVYQIGTAEELYWFAGLINGTLSDTSQNASANAVLTGDIEINGSKNETNVSSCNGVPDDDWVEWASIGYYTSSSKYIRYDGTFDGQGYTISGVYLNDSSAVRTGLFGYIGTKASVKNLSLENSYICGYSHVGGICGYNYMGTITGCSNAASVVSSTSYAGGIFSYSYSGKVTNCSNKGAISAASYAGGICAYNNGTISNSYSTGRISADSYAGGICGYNNKSATYITGCYYLSGTAQGGVNGSDISGSAEAETGDGFENGRVTYLLNGSVDGGTTWYQNIDNGQEPDALPVLDSSHGAVYHGFSHADNKAIYSNSEVVADAHSFVNGFCECGEYEEPAISEEYYQISNGGELYWFADFVNRGNSSANAVLTGNIYINDYDSSGNTDVSGCGGTAGDGWKEWSTIGYYSSSSNHVYYTGTFDGNCNVISGLYYNNSNASYAGLIGYIGDGGTVENLGIENSYICGSSYVGGICGYNNGGTVENCYNTGSIYASANYAGGICGYNYKKTIKNCLNAGSVTVSKSYAGGISGYNNASGTSAKIESCCNIGSVSAQSVSYGGIVGRNNNDITKITNCCYLSGTAECGAYNGSTKLVSSEGYIDVKTAEEFETGEVSWILNGRSEGSAWLQTIGTDSKPLLGVFNPNSLPVVEITTENGETVYANAVTEGISLSISGSELLGVTINTNIYGGESGEYLNSVGVVIDDVLYYLTNYYYVDDNGNYSESTTDKAFFPVARASSSAETVTSVRGEATASSVGAADESLLYFVTEAAADLTVNEAADSSNGDITYYVMDGSDSSVVNVED